MYYVIYLSMTNTFVMLFKFNMFNKRFKYLLANRVDVYKYFIFNNLQYFRVKRVIYSMFAGNV